MKRSRTVYNSMDALAGMSMVGASNNGMSARGVILLSDDTASSLTYDALDRSNKLYHKNKKATTSSVASDSRHDWTDCESDVSSNSISDDVAANDTTYMNRLNRMLGVGNDSVRTSYESQDFDLFGCVDNVSLLDCSKLFGNPCRNDSELVATFNLLEVGV